MRVLQISKFYPPVAGGIESTVRELTEGLNARGVPTDVLCANLAPASVRSRQNGYDVVRAASLGTVLSTSLAPSLVWHLRRMAPAYDVLHVHMPDPMAALALRLARPEAALVVHWHSDVIRQRMALRAYEPLQRWLLDRADAVIATSPPYLNASAPLRPWRDKVHVVPIGISDNPGRTGGAGAAAIRARLGGRRLVFALGRMTYYKGFDVLIDAAALLPDDVAVVIGGCGELLERLRAQASERGLEGRVFLPGRIDDDELPSYFQACDVFCLPSTARSEAYGVCILEAMMMGRPVVATDIPGSGVPWVNRDGETGLNVPPTDVAALAAALSGLLADPARARAMGRAGRERYLQHFDASAMTTGVLELYGRLRPARSEDRPS